jgi:ribosomal protein S26
MGNQQLSTLEERIKLLARNGRLGDGSLWKHSESINCKYIATSIKLENLQLKLDLVPEIFKTGIKSVDCSNHSGRFPNAKQLYRLASIVNPIFTAYKKASRESIYAELNILDFVLWFKDDGCVYQRKDRNSKKYILCIGASISTPELKASFTSTLIRIFGSKWGHFEKNNSKATEFNYSLLLPVRIGEFLTLSYLDLQERLKAFDGESSTTIL